jgi:hypothetical protein
MERIDLSFLFGRFATGCRNVPHPVPNKPGAWVFVLGVSYRLQMTRSASDLANRYERDADAELVELSRALARVPGALPQTGKWP